MGAYEDILVANHFFPRDTQLLRRIFPVKISDLTKQPGKKHE